MPTIISEALSSVSFPSSLLSLAFQNASISWAFPTSNSSHAQPFFRVSLSSSSHQGRLIKSYVDINTRKLHLLNCLSRFPLEHSCRSLDLLEFTVSEIQQVYEVQDCYKQSSLGFKRVVIVKDAGNGCFSILALDFYGCLRNAIYFTNKGDETEINVFKLDDGRIATMSEYKHKCMFPNVCS